MADSSGRSTRSSVETWDLDLSSVKNAAELGQLLKTVRSRADLSYRDLEQASKHSFNLSKSAVGEALGGKFPRKEFLATFLDVCGVPPEQRKDWLATWERLAPTCTPNGRKTRIAQVIDEADQLEQDARARADAILLDAQQRAERLDHDARTRADTVLRDAHDRAERLEKEARTRADTILSDAQQRGEQLAKTVAADRVATMAKQILLDVRAKADKDRDQRMQATTEDIEEMLHLAKNQAQQMRVDTLASAEEVKTRVRSWVSAQIKDTRAITEQMIASTQAKLAAREEAVALEYAYTWQRADAIADLAYAHRRRWRLWKWQQFNKLAEASTETMLIKVARRIAADPESPLAQIAQHCLAEIEAPLPQLPPSREQFPVAWPLQPRELPI